MPEANVIRTGEGMTLTPDPSVLTRQSIDRSIAAQREISRVELAGEVAALRARIDAMDKAIVVFNDNLTRVPTDVDKQVGNLDKLTSEKFATVDQRFQVVDEKFVGVEVRFAERDERVKESAIARDTAVAAALQAQKEAAFESKQSFSAGTDKSEKATGEQINQQRVLLETTTKGLNDKIDDLKERLGRAESIGIGQAELRAVVTALQNDIRDLRESRSSQQGGHERGVDMRIVLFAMLGFLFTFVTIAIAVVALVTR